MRQFQTLFNEQIVLRSLLLCVWETEVLKNYRFELKIVVIYVNLGLNKTIIFNCQIHTENNLNKYIYILLLSIMPQTKPHRKFENKEVKKIQCANRNRYKGVEAILIVI